MVQGCNRGTVSNSSKRCSVMRVNCVVGHGFYFMGGMPRSLQIFFAKKSLISLCLGIADLLFKAGLCHHECRPPSRKKLTTV